MGRVGKLLDESHVHGVKGLVTFSTSTFTRLNDCRDCYTIVVYC